MNYNQMINFLANPNTNLGHISHHDGHHRDNFNNHVTNDQYQKSNNHQFLQINHSLGSQKGSPQYYKIKETSQKQTRNRTKFTDEQIEKLEGSFSTKILRQARTKWFLI